MSRNDEWNYPCSDDELMSAGSIEDGEWTPSGAELEALYNAIESSPDGVPVSALEWRSPGRHPPREAAPAQRTERTPDTPQMPANTNFDFMEEMGSFSLRMRRENEDTLRGSAKKKTSSFDGIVSNMMRHKRIQQMEREADNPPPQ